MATSTVDLRVFSMSGIYIVPGVGAQSTALSGAGKLTQRVLKCLLTTPGGDIFDPEWGAGLLNALPATGSSDTNQNQSVDNNVQLAVLSAEQQILSDQTTSGAVPEELLAALTVLKVAYEVESTSWNVQIAIKSKAGTVTNANVQV